MYPEEFTQKQRNEAFYNYIKPIVSNCSGFIKTEGYMVYIPSPGGWILITDADSTHFGIITIVNPSIQINQLFVAKINTFLSLKEISENLVDQLYFLGGNKILRAMLDTFNKFYYHIDEDFIPLYYEEDCHNIPGFDEANSSVNITQFKIIDKATTYYLIPVSKAITTATKSDKISLSIYSTTHYADPRYKTLRYQIYKKKYGVWLDLFATTIQPQCKI